MARLAHKTNGTLVLTEMEEAVIDAYTQGAATAVQAAREAGYKQAVKLSYALLQKPHIKKEIERRQKLLQDRSDFGLQRLMDWTAFAATYNPKSIFRTGTFEILPLDEWPDQQLCRLVEKFKVTEFTDKDGNVTRKIEVGFIGRNPNLDRLAAMMGVKKAHRDFNGPDAFDTDQRH